MKESHRRLLEHMINPTNPRKKSILVLMPSEYREETRTNEVSCQAEDSGRLQEHSYKSSGIYPSESVLRTRARPVSLTPEIGYYEGKAGRRNRGRSLIEKKCITPKLQQLLDVPMVPPLPLPFLKKPVRKLKQRKATILPPLSPYRFLEIEGISPSSSEKSQRWDLELNSPTPVTAYRRRLIRFTEARSRLPSHISEASLPQQPSP